MRRGTDGTSRRKLVIVADDLGRSPEVNRAVEEACDRGVVTCASIMAGGAAFEEAVAIATERAHLSIGLHVTLCDGNSVLPHGSVPDLAGPDGSFCKGPEKTWLKASRPGVLHQIRKEVEAQFERLQKAGIRASHVDSHHHLHMHPSIFEIVCREASKRGVGWVRIPREPLSVLFRKSALRRGIMPFVEWPVFRMLGVFNRKTAGRCGLAAAHQVLGLASTGGLDERHVLALLELSRGPVTEIFVHPDLATEAGREEFGALTSPLVKERLSHPGLQLTGYSALSAGAASFSGQWGRA